jgi:hypothetical protein
MKRSISRKEILSELRAYQKYFRIGGSRDWKLECQRAIYVLRTLLHISWDQEKDKYLGWSVKL